MHDRKSLVVVEAMLGHQLGYEASVQPAGHVATGRDLRSPGSAAR
jgi:hypothetical protein